MDARHALERLQALAAELGDRPTPREALEAFVPYAREVSDYEDGGVDDDAIGLTTVTLDDPSQWHPTETRPQEGSLLVSFDRDISITDEDGDYIEHAGVALALVFAPPAHAVLGDRVEISAPAGMSLADPEDPDSPDTTDGYVTTLEEFVTAARQALGELFDTPALAVHVDGDVPTEPTQASLATPAANAVHIPLEPEGYINSGYADDDLDTQLRARRIGSGDPLDTRRALTVLVEFCARPLECGNARVVRDELLLTFNGPFPNEPEQTCRLDFKRQIELAPRGPGDADWAEIGFSLSYNQADDLVGLPDWLTFRAPGASSPGGVLGAPTDAGAPHIELQRLNDIVNAVEASPIATVLARRADSVRWAAVV